VRQFVNCNKKLAAAFGKEAERERKRKSQIKNEKKKYGSQISLFLANGLTYKVDIQVPLSLIFRRLSIGKRLEAIG